MFNKGSGIGHMVLLNGIGEYPSGDVKEMVRVYDSARSGPVGGGDYV